MTEQSPELRLNWWKNTELLGGLLLVAIAALALWAVNDLPARQGFRFASGTAPRIFAYGLGGLGLMIALASFRQPAVAMSRPAWRATACIIGALLLFAVGIRPLGLVLTGMLSVILASFATSDVRWRETVLFAIGITAFCVLIFPVALNQPVPLWPSFPVR